MSMVSRGNDTSAAYENAYYLSATGEEMIRIRVSEIGDDIYDVCRIAYSQNHGSSWSEDRPHQVSFATMAGIVRKGFGVPVADPHTKRLVVLDTTSVLPNDHMLEALTYTFPTYRVSDDGGTTWLFEDRIIESGEAYSAAHPMRSVFTGKNAVHYANTPFFDRAGRLIVPVQITRLQEDDSLFCPDGALSFHEMVVLIGTWANDGRMDWTASQTVTMEPDISTRGAVEGAIAEMPDGRFIMIMRGSNSGNPDLPGHKWFCTSSDGCLTWSNVRVWGYSDGTYFHSPSSYSTVIAHSNGRFYWIGNICADNPSGNGPDYPVVVGEIEATTGLLDRNTIMEIDTYREDDPAPVHLRNFTVYEDRSTKELVMRMTRLWVDDNDHMRGNAFMYRLVV